MKELWNKFTDRFGTTIFHPQYVMLYYTKRALVLVKKNASETIVDIGSGRMPYRQDLQKRYKTVIAIDHPKVANLYKGATKPDIYADVCDKLPIKSNNCNVCTLLQVLEYLEKPERAFKEIFRILKPGGLLVLSSPFLYPIHDAPYDRSRFTDTQINYLLKTAGFEKISCNAQGNFWEFWTLSLLVFMFVNLKKKLAQKDFFSYFQASVIFTCAAILTPVLNISNLVLRHFTKNKTNPFVLNYIVTAKKPLNN